jgi:hypothetical protein
MARIQGLPKNKTGLMSRLVYWMARRRLGKVPEPLTLIAHHPWLSRGYGLFELALDRSRLVDTRLKELATLKVATLVGCPF